MYSCVRGLIRANGVNERLVSVNVNGMAVRTLAAEYSYAVLILTNPAITHEVSLDIRDVALLIYKLNPDTTIDQWLSSIGDTSLPTSDVIPSPTSVISRYNDAFNAGYHVEKIHPLAGDGNEFPDRYLTTLRLTRDDTDYSDLFKHVLVTVNGLLHLTDYSTAGLTVLNGGSSVSIANDNQVGLISFKDVGEIVCDPITLSMITARLPNLPLNQGIVIKVPGANFTTETVMVSFAGILLHSQQYYQVLSDDTLLLEWWKIPVWQMYYAVAKLMDVDLINTVLGRTPTHGDALDLNVLNATPVIQAFLLLAQTFVIRIKTTGFYVERHPVERTGLPGRYYTYTLPRFPLQLSNGLLPAYLAQHEDDVYVLQIAEGFNEYKVHESRNDSDGMYVHSGNESALPREYAAAYLLEMGKDL